MIGWAYARRGLPALAVLSLELAIEKNPSNPQSFDGALDAQRMLDALGG